MIKFNKKNQPAVTNIQAMPSKSNSSLDGKTQSIMGKFRASSKIFTAFAILIIIAGSFAYYFIFVKTSNKTHYVYPDMESYSLAGTAPEAGVSFTKPKVFIKYAEATGQVLFHQSDIANGNTQTTVAYLAAASNAADKPYSDEQLLDLKTILAGTTSYYGKVVGPINDFVRSRLPGNWQINLDRPGIFFNKDISDNAWQFNFSASNPTNKKVTFKGQILYAIKANNSYYFMVATTSDNWQTNQKTWQQIFGSIEVGI